MEKTLACLARACRPIFIKAWIAFLVLYFIINREEVYGRAHAPCDREGTKTVIWKWRLHPQVSYPALRKQIQNLRILHHHRY